MNHVDTGELYPVNIIMVGSPHTREGVSWQALAPDGTKSEQAKRRNIVVLWAQRWLEEHHGKEIL